MAKERKKKFLRTPISMGKIGHVGMHLSFQQQQEVSNRRIMVQVSLDKK
jgi:hypothetical protein